ncbi:MAG: deoxyhypusine synthase family protein [Myxococcota bacterium]
MPTKIRDPNQYHDGHEDGFEPVESIDINRIDSFSDMLKAYSRCSFGARRVGDALSVMEAMANDHECLVVCTLSGAMTVAKMGLVICEMIERGYIDVIVSTGALQAHGMIEGSGMKHFKYRADMNDQELYEKGYDRVYDTLELERNLDSLEAIVSPVLDGLDAAHPLASRHIMSALGHHLSKHFPGERGILKSAFEHNVPVFIPAFTDSELGLDVATNNIVRAEQNRPTLRFDPFLDLEAYTQIVRDQKRVGIFTIGGGVPRNWAQQVGPFLEISQLRLGRSEGLTQKFSYGVRICPEPENWGGLSGCSYAEGTSWGKFIPETEGGRYAEVPIDATVVWPLLVKALTEMVPSKPNHKERMAIAGELP